MTPPLTPPPWERTSGRLLAAIEARRGTRLPLGPLVAALDPLLEDVAQAHEQGCVIAFLGGEAVRLDLGRLFVPLGAVVPPRLVAEVEAGSREAPAEMPLGYTAWEEGPGHHDALTDLHIVGRIGASLALGLDLRLAADRDRLAAHREDPRGLSADLDPRLARWLSRTLAARRRARPQSARDLLRALRRLARGPRTGALAAAAARPATFLERALESLQHRLFDRSRRNRLLHFKAGRRTLDLTVSSCPVHHAPSSVRDDALLVFDGSFARGLLGGEDLDLAAFLPYAEAPYLPAALDDLRREAARVRREVGLRPLHLVLAFLDWRNLREAPRVPIRSPLLLLGVELRRRRGVKDTHTLSALEQTAEVNPVLRRELERLYGVRLPDAVDLSERSLASAAAALVAQLEAAAPELRVALRRRPDPVAAHERARTELRRRLGRRSTVGADERPRRHGVAYSYDRADLLPLGLGLFSRYVRTDLLVPHDARALPRASAFPGLQATARRRAPAWTDGSGEPGEGEGTAWTVDLGALTLAVFADRKTSLVRDYEALLEGRAASVGSVEALLRAEAAPVLQGPPEARTPLELACVVPADPTQARAVAWARAGRSFIVQGPPGTGKSQTIANLLADAVLRGERVLFVCEKRAAIDVVYDRLAEQGLGGVCARIHDARADRATWLEDAGVAYRAHLGGDEDAAAALRARDEARAAVEAELAPLTRALRALGRAPLDAAAPLSTLISRVLAARAGEDGADEPPPASIRERLPRHARWAPHAARARRVSEVLAARTGRAPLSASPLRWLGEGVLAATDPLGALRRLIGRSQRAIGELRDALSGGGAPIEGGRVTLQDLEDLARVAQRLRPFAAAGALGILRPDGGRRAALTACLEAREVARAGVREAATETRGWRARLAEADLERALTQARRLEGAWFSWLRPAWWRLRSALARGYDFEGHEVRPGWVEVLETLRSAYATEAAFARAERALDATIGGSGASMDDLVTALRGWDANRGGLAPVASRLAAWVEEDPPGGAAWVRALAAIEPLVLSLAASWRVEAPGLLEVGLAEAGERLGALRQARAVLGEVAADLAVLRAAGDDVWGPLSTLPVDAGTLDRWVTARAAARGLRDDPDVSRLDGPALGRAIRALGARYDAWLAANRRAVAAAVRGRFLARVRRAARPRASLRSEEDRAFASRYGEGRRLLEREMEKGARHRTIRDLLASDAGLVLRDLKPLWLMSPLSVADVLPIEGAGGFDLCVFDEASQIRVEEAVPALARAPRAVVVGDAMQLPPTTFFAAAVGDDDDDDGDEYGDGPEASLDREVAEELRAESFLELCARRFPSTMLGWHYRSRREALIRFCNEAFYGGRLLTIPDPAREGPRPPIVAEGADAGDRAAASVLDRAISFHRVAGGVYAGRRNQAEARYIARMVRGLLAAAPGRTLGVVAFSERQESEIEEALAELGEQDPAFRALLEESGGIDDEAGRDGLFVKNLENVQGDERDIIVLSVCYGPGPDGRVRMNFGPINRAGGERRLNVVFSRARHHMAVVASMDGERITATYNDGARSLRAYLRYASACSEGDPDGARRALREVGGGGGGGDARAAHPARAAVAAEIAAELEAAGYRSARALGAGGFRVDLAVGRADEESYRVAVLVLAEGDPEPSAALADWLFRPRVLEAFGWRVEVVPAAEWLAEPDRINRRLRRRLQPAAR